jgi:hypothetical protein
MATVPRVSLSAMESDRAPREILICLPFRAYEQNGEFLKLAGTLISRFGIGARLVPLPSVPGRWVVEAGHDSPCVPSLAALDRAFHDASVLPGQIARLLLEAEELNSGTESADAEIRQLLAEKSRLALAIEETREQISSLNRTGIRRSARALRKSAQRLTDRALPPSEDLSPDEDGPAARGALIARFHPAERRRFDPR